MKVILIFIISLSLQASIVSKSTYMNKDVSFDIEEKETIALEDAINNILSVNENIVENIVDAKKDKKWKATGYVTSLGITSSGKIGVMGLKGTAMTEIFWRRKVEQNNLYKSNTALNAENSEVVITSLDKNGINETVETLMAVVKNSGKVSNLNQASVTIKQQLLEFTNIVSEVYVDKNKPWYLSGIRMDLALSVSGKLIDIYSVGGAIALKVVYVPVRERDSSPYNDNSNTNTIDAMVRDLSNVLYRIEERKILEESDLKLSVIRFGLGMSAAKKVHLGNTSGSLSLSILMNKNPKYEAEKDTDGHSFNPINRTLAVAENNQIKNMDWKLFEKGLRKSIKISKKIVKKSRKNNTKAKWEINMVRSQFALSPSKGIGLTTISGTGLIQITYKK